MYDILNAVKQMECQAEHLNLSCVRSKKVWAIPQLTHVQGRIDHEAKKM